MSKSLLKDKQTAKGASLLDTLLSGRQRTAMGGVCLVKGVFRNKNDRVGSKSIVAPLGFGNLQFPAESLSPISFTPQQVIFFLST